MIFHFFQVALLSLEAFCRFFAAVVVAAVV